MVSRYQHNIACTIHMQVVPRVQCAYSMTNELQPVLLTVQVFITGTLFFPSSSEEPTHVNNISVNIDEKTITWTAPAETNGIIVRYRIQYCELGRNDTAEEFNTTTAEGLMFSYGNLCKLQYIQHVDTLITLTVHKTQFKCESISKHCPQLKVYLTKCKFKLLL